MKKKTAKENGAMQANTIICKFIVTIKSIRTSRHANHKREQFSFYFLTSENSAELGRFIQFVLCMHVNNGCDIVSIGRRKVSIDCNGKSNSSDNGGGCDGDDSRNNNNTSKQLVCGDLATAKKSRANQQLQRNFINAAYKLQIYTQLS